MKQYLSCPIERKEVILKLVKEIQHKPKALYRISEDYHLILIKDERQLNTYRRYNDSPFPLLTNIEYFKNSIGGWNKELKEFGLNNRAKLDEPCTSSHTGNRIHLISKRTLNCKGNISLRKQYKRLQYYRSTKQISNYWILSWNLMKHSLSFRLACLSSWKPLWYKELRLQELNKLWKDLSCIINLQQIRTNIYNVWIESPKGKWRQLGVPNKPWRLYLHMLNMFISYIYSPNLDSAIYDGFIYQRGCKSWWETVIWSDLLTKYSWIMEVDFSSGFPNLNLHIVRRALLEDGLIPENIINLILNHLKSKLIEAPYFPTLETYIENCENKPWRASDRSVHMGLGISPILYVITCSWALKQINLYCETFKYKWYADDGSFYFQTSWLIQFLYNMKLNSLWNCIKHLENPIIFELNNLPLFQETGLKFCTKKSRIIKALNIWIRSYKSLGLELFTHASYLNQLWSNITNQPIPLNLKGSTRGRGANPLKGKLPTTGSQQLLDFHSDNNKRLNFTLMKSKYQSYFGYLMSRLYAPNNPNQPKPQGLLSTCQKGSLLWTILTRQGKKYLQKSYNLHLYNAGSKMSELWLQILKGNKTTISVDSQIKKYLTIDWQVSGQSILTENIENPLKEPSSNQWAQDYFKKYSEIELTEEQISNYKKLYANHLKEISTSQSSPPTIS